MTIYCCDVMKDQLTQVGCRHHDRFQCPDVLVDSRYDHGKMIGLCLPIKDGGRSSIRIFFCPFCGKSVRNIVSDTPYDEAGQENSVIILVANWLEKHAKVWLDLEQQEFHKSASEHGARALNIAAKRLRDGTWKTLWSKDGTD